MNDNSLLQIRLLLSQALSAINSSRWGAAESHCKEILARHPDQIDTMYLLGLIKNPEIRQSSASFYDLNLRFNQKVGKDGVMYLSYYQSSDKLRYEDAFGFNWSIHNASIGWNNPLNENFFSASSRVTRPLRTNAAPH